MLRILFVALFALLVSRGQAMLYGGSFDSPEERASVEAGEDLFERREYDLAWESALASAQQLPESYEAKRLLVLVAHQVDKLTEVFRLYDPASVTDPSEKARAHYVRAWSSLLMGDLHVAKAESERARSIAPAPEFEIERVWLVSRRNFPGADLAALKPQFLRLVETYRDVPPAWVSLANMFNFVGYKSAEHLAAIEEGLRAAPSPQLYNAKLELEADKFWGDPAVVYEMAMGAIAQFPRSTTLGRWEVRCLRELGRTEEALAAARRWLELSPNNADLRFDEIGILQDLERNEEALARNEALSEVRHQRNHLEHVMIQRAELLHALNRRPEALVLLDEYLATSPSPRRHQQASLLRSRLLSAPEDATLRVLPPFRIIRQRGNYCGPATMSALLAQWGIEQPQEAVATHVYTGIAGTPPQVLYHYALQQGLESAEFRGTDDLWRRAIDAGYPILWLQMLGSRGAHYRIIVGYDDVLQQWIIQDPNNHERTRWAYESTADLWFLPDLRRSIIFFPPEKGADPLFAELQSTPLLVITNWVLFVATGANVFVSFWPAFPLNILIAAGLTAIILFLLRCMTFPHTGLRARYFFLGIVGLVAPVNLAIAIFRWGGMVSLLLSLHLALLSLIPLLLFMLLVQRLLRDYLHPRESIGLCLMVAATWIFLSFVDEDPWQWAIPVSIFVLGMPVLLYPRLRLQMAERCLARGSDLRALEIARPFAESSVPWWTAMAIVRAAQLRRGELGPFAENVARAGSLKLPGSLGRLLSTEKVLAAHLVGRSADVAATALGQSVSPAETLLRWLAGGKESAPPEREMEQLERRLAGIRSPAQRIVLRTLLATVAAAGLAKAPEPEHWRRRWLAEFWLVR